MSAAGRNPFPGLRPFREDEEHLFFGRESKVDVMVDKLAVTRFLAVVGTSGSGKSSLVNCGLRPALHRGLMSVAGSSWRVAQFRPGVDPIGGLADVLAARGVLFPAYDGELPLAEIIETYLTQSATGLADTVRMANLPTGTNLLVVVDQFEELFRFRQLGGDGTDGTSEAAIAFINLLLTAHAAPDVPIYVVLTMRSDYLGDCAQFYGLPEAINQGQYLVPRLTREERRASIAGPVAVGGAEISPVLLTRLVNDVGDNPDQLSILQHALNRTWACWESHGATGPLTLRHYDEIGSMARALNQHADEAFAALGSARREKICELIFKALTDLGTDPRGIRRPTKFGTLCALVGGAADAEEVAAVIEIFRDPARSFLMPPAPEPLGAERVIDISHESLMRVWEKLRLWAAEEAKSAHDYRRLAETAIREAAQQAGLWRDPDLQLALDWRRKHAPTATWAELYGGGFETAVAFLEKSRLARDTVVAGAMLERQWRGRWRVAIFIFCGVIAFVIYEILQDSSLRQTLLNQQNSSGGRVWILWNAIVDLVPLLFYLGPPVALFFLLEYVGRRAYRRKMLPKLLQEIAEAADRPAGAETAGKTVLAGASQTLDTSPASKGRRLGAYLLDLAIFAVASAIIVAGIMDTQELSELINHTTYGGLMLLTPLLLNWIYEAKMLSSRRQATLGMKWMGIFAANQEGKPLSFSAASAWHFAKLLLYVTLGIGFFMQSWTKRHQSLSDLVTRTVIRSRPDQRKLPWWMYLVFVLIGLAFIPLLVASLLALLYVIASIL